jgi:hypothetical protein
MNRNGLDQARAIMACEPNRPGAVNPRRRPTTPTAWLFLAAALFCAACAAAATPPPGGDETEDTGRDAAVAARDSAADRGRANPPPDAPSPDLAPAAPADASAPDLAPDTTADAAVPAGDGDVGQDGRAADGPPATSTAYLVERLEGDVTARELDTFIAVTSAAAIPTAMWTADNPASHNILCAFGRGGYTLEAINLVYEIARDAGMSAQQRRLLDLAITWSDQWLVHRNDLPLGEHRVLWTGKVEPTWPPNHPQDAEAAYAGSESADTVGTLAHTALNLVRAPELASMTVPDGDPNHLGATYLARAKTYLAMLEVAMDKFYVPSFLDPQSSTIRHPSAPAYAIPGTPGGSQNVNAWNRMMFFLNAFQTLGQLHHLLGDDAAKDALYRKVVENTIDAFVKAAVPHNAADGTPVYDWGYGDFGDILHSLSNEDLSHGNIDIMGLTRATRSGYGHTTAAQLKTYANTVMHEIRIGPGVYAGTVNRAKATSMATSLPVGWLTLSPYLPGLYQAVAADMLAPGGSTRHAGVAGYVLWAKHWAAVGGLRAP